MIRIFSLLTSGGLAAMLVSCGPLSRRNAHQTVIADRSPPVNDFLGSYVYRQDTRFLNYDEIKLLAANPSPGGKLENKLASFFNRPIISNEAWHRGERPTLARNETLGDFLRIATWNIAQSRRATEIINLLSNESAIDQMVDSSKAQPDSDLRAELERKRERLASADVILLQEVDIGMPRSGYRDTARDLARALQMNYAYAPMQLEVDPVNLGLEAAADGSMQAPEKTRYKGVFGLAVLSRYPIKNVQCFQLKTQPYDWYHGESAPPQALELGRRHTTKWLFENQTLREMKIGGRIFFRVDLDIPGLPENTLTVIHNHLEIKTRPRHRQAQLEEILTHIKDIPHTVVMAGDHNTTRMDLSPTSTLRAATRTASDSETWFSVASNVLLSLPALANSGRVLINHIKNLHSPLALDIPVILPNETRRLFNQLEEFRFDDGGQFDFRGNRQRSINGSTAKLGNSNEAAIKGHQPTFQVNRPIGPFGRGRLDWIFVKAPPYAQPDGVKSYRLAPHFGETLSGLIEHLDPQLSDHSPCVLDLPLQEPPGLSDDSKTKHFPKHRSRIGRK